MRGRGRRGRRWGRDIRGASGEHQLFEVGPPAGDELGIPSRGSGVGRWANAKGPAEVMRGGDARGKRELQGLGGEPLGQLGVARDAMKKALVEAGKEG